MRILGSKTNKIRIRDLVSADVHELDYRPPTNQERVKYQNGLVRREGKAVKNRIFETRVAFGKDLLTGFKKGTFGTAEGTVFSSDPTDADYRPDWKDLIESGAPEVLAVLAEVAFEGASAIGPEPIPEEDDESGSDPTP